MIKRYNQTDRMSGLLSANGFAFLSGLTPKNRSVGVKEQTAEVLGQIDAYLAEAGTDKSRIVVANIWLKDIGSFAEMNAAWDAWVPKGAAPARATVESRLAAPDILVEIQVQALL